jgi:molybdopterin converting factor subunit 1
MKSINIKYFALFRDQSGCEEETLQVTSETYADLYHTVSKLHGFDLPHDMIQVAVNDEFTSMKTQVVDQAKVVFIPPVAGG